MAYLPANPVTAGVARQRLFGDRLMGDRQQIYGFVLQIAVDINYLKP